MPDREPPAPSLSYASDSETLDAPLHTFRRRAILACVWLIGLTVWAVYLAMIVWLVFQIFA